MKGFLKKILFGTKRPHTILMGVSAGMKVDYDPGDRSLHLLGLYEREIYPFFRRSSAKAATLIDIGANDGYYALAFAKHKNKKIVLCEPGEEKEKLRKNMSLNGFVEHRDFEVVEKFVSDTTNDTNISISELVKDQKNIFILMDVDGGEQRIIEQWAIDPTTTIDWLIETHSLAFEENITRILTRLGYQVTIIPNAWWRKFIPEKRPLAHNRWMYAVKN